jgi:hypothetical protein
MGERRHATWIDDGKPPQVHLSELPNLQESRPFDRLEFLSIDPASTYNWHNETARSIHLATADKLIAELQAHDAVRALNHMGHYKRDYKRFIVDNTELRQRIHASYEKGIRRFFSGKGADIKHIYCHCSWCGEFAEQLKQTDCCGVRLCPGCEDQKLGHEITCSTYSVS